MKLTLSQPGWLLWHVRSFEFVGYSRTHKGYRCYCPLTRGYYVTADVSFLESTPYYVDRAEPPDLQSSLFLPLPTPIVPVAKPTTPTPAAPPILRVYTKRPRDPPPPVSSDVPTSDPPCKPTTSSPTEDLPIALRKGARTCTTRHPLDKVVAYSRIEPKYNAFLSALDSVTVPASISDALSHPGWREVMFLEMQALESTHTWDLCALCSWYLVFQLLLQ